MPRQATADPLGRDTAAGVRRSHLFPSVGVHGDAAPLFGSVQDRGHLARLRTPTRPEGLMVGASAGSVPGRSLRDGDHVEGVDTDVVVCAPPPPARTRPSRTAASSGAGTSSNIEKRALASDDAHVALGGKIIRVFVRVRPDSADIRDYLGRWWSGPGSSNLADLEIPRAQWLLVE